MFHRAIAIGMTTLLLTTGAQASVVFDTVTGGSMEGYSGPGSDGSNIMATSFSTAGSPDFSSISLLMLADNPTDGGSVMVYLVPDDGTGAAVGTAGSPYFSGAVQIGSILDSSLSATSTATPSLITLSGVVNTLVTSNNEYWIALDATGSSAEWIYNSGSTAGSTANQSSYSDYNGLYSDAGGATPGAFAMTVTTQASTSDTPEPASVTLLGGSLVGLGYFWRRRPKKA